MELMLMDMDPASEKMKRYVLVNKIRYTKENIQKREAKMKKQEELKRKRKALPAFHKPKVPPHKVEQVGMVTFHSLK